MAENLASGETPAVQWHELVDAEDEPVVLDVRTAAEHARGTVTVPWQEPLVMALDSLRERHHERLAIAASWSIAR
ncbi:hypothetical protein [Demequina litorisediminis]|uniref:hypothetical protein n=1 Tax=Demequina litorisediminis TaxID=1849022 RepID=UPI0032B00DF1